MDLIQSGRTVPPTYEEARRMPAGAVLPPRGNPFAPGRSSKPRGTIMSKHLRTSVAAFSAFAVVLVGCATDDTVDDTTDVTEPADDVDADAETEEEVEVEEEEEVEEEAETEEEEVGTEG